jgi:hypothetical protein
MTDQINLARIFVAAAGPAAAGDRAAFRGATARSQ